MDSETKELLEETLETARENNKMLKKMQSNMFWGRVFRIAYWVIIIGSMLGLYYFLQPFFDSIFESYREVIKFFGGNPDMSVGIQNIPDLLNR